MGFQDFRPMTGSLLHTVWAGAIQCRRQLNWSGLTARFALRATMGVMRNHIGLRERRRRQTSADIRDAAVRLALQRGFDKVTIEEICVEAGISSRTFFNYFPNKES